LWSCTALGEDLLRNKQTVISAVEVAMMACVVMEMGRNIADRNIQPD